MEIKQLKTINKLINNGDKLLFSYIDIIKKYKKTDEQMFFEKEINFDNRTDSGVFKESNIQYYEIFNSINFKLLTILNNSYKDKIIHLGLVEVQGILLYFYNFFNKNYKEFKTNFKTNLSVFNSLFWDSVNNFKLINSGLDKLSSGIFLLYCPQVQIIINDIEKLTITKEKIASINKLNMLLKKPDFKSLVKPDFIKKHNLNFKNIEWLMEKWTIIVNSFYWEFSDERRNALEHRLQYIELKEESNLNPFIVVNLYILLRFFWLSINLKQQELNIV